MCKNDKWHTDGQHASPLAPIEKTEIYYECPVCGNWSGSKTTIEKCIKNHGSLDENIIRILDKDWNDRDFNPPIEFEDLLCAVDTDDCDIAIGIDINLLKENLNIYKNWLIDIQNKVDQLLIACSK